MSTFSDEDDEDDALGTDGDDKERGEDASCTPREEEVRARRRRRRASVCGGDRLRLMIMAGRVKCELGAREARSLGGLSRKS